MRHPFSTLVLGVPARRVLSVCIVAATAAVLAACAQTAWQKPGSTEQNYAADMAACDQYVADNGDSAAFEARLGHSRHRANAARLMAEHRRLHAHMGSRGHGQGHTGGNGGKGEAIAAGAVIVAAVAITAAENAQLHDDCMLALGWTPGTNAAPIVLAANNPTNLAVDAGTDGPPSQLTDYPALGFSVSGVTPLVAYAENLDTHHGVLITAVVPGSPAAVLGLAQGDVALFFNDNPIRSGDDLASAVERASTELQGSIVVWRNRDELRFTFASRGD